MNAVTPSCEICQSPKQYYFSKTYAPYPGSPYSDALKVDYWRCQGCGFVMSDTHQRMSPQYWGQLNLSWHSMVESDHDSRPANQPPYADQALAMTMLARNGLIDLDNALDFAGGHGTLSKFLRKYFGTPIAIYDPYMQDSSNGLRYVPRQELGRWRLVVNSAMFEHVLSRAGLDEINAAVADDGVLMLHTVVCERVPPDPNWFYLAPVVHTAFHTNRSMALLMAQWGYAASVYAPQAKSWFLFKQGHRLLTELPERVRDINRELQTTYFHYKPGFVDYWKGF